MPCLILTGHPSVGKTTLAEKIKERALQHSSQRITSVVIVNESTACPGLTQAECYLNSHNEKKTRAALKACFDHAVVGGDGSTTTNNNSSVKATKNQQQQQQQQLVILDSLNYIKGFRYELFCISKAAGEQHGVIWVLNSMETALAWNRERNSATSSAENNNNNDTKQKQHVPFYTDRSMEELIRRFEPPDERNRWDKPLYKVDMRPLELKQKEQMAAADYDNEGDILEKSVYNMHALSDVMGNNTTTEASNDTETASATTNGTTTAPKKKTFKGFKRAPKTAKPVQPTVVSPNAITTTGTSTEMAAASNYTDATAVLYPKNFLYSSQPSEEPLHSSSIGNNDHHPDSDKNIDSTTQSNRFNPSLRRPKKQSPALPPKPDPLSSVDDQINAILDSFLLHVRPLTEGMSTQRPAVAGSANVLHEMDAITQTVCDAIVQEQTQGTLVGGRIPIMFQQTATTTSGSSTGQADHHRLFLNANRLLPQAELRRLRRQYLRWVATHPPDDCDTEYGIARSFVTYIEAQL